MPLILIGYWYEPQRRGRAYDPALVVATDPEQRAKVVRHLERLIAPGPDPQKLIGPISADPDERAAVVRYLRHGRSARTFMGFSYCRFACGIADEEMGSGERSDGRWIWPSGLTHYVEVHDVDLPPEFLAHVRKWEYQHPVEADRTASGMIDEEGIDPSLWEAWARSRGAWRDS